jgi:hypothetical protein
MLASVRMEAIREALFDDDALAALPAWLARAVGARSAMILWRHMDGVHEVLAFNHFTPANASAYAYKYAALDPLLKAARLSGRRDELLCLDDFVPPSTFARSRFHREFVRPLGDDIARAAVAVFGATSGEVLVVLHRGSDAAPFTSSDMDPLDDCLPRLSQVLCARGETLARRRRRQVARDDLDGLALGAVIIGRDGRIARMNLTADLVLRRADGFLSRRGVLSCADPGSRMRLHAALALATAPDNPIATAIPVERVSPTSDGQRRGERPLAYMVSVTPAPREEGQSLSMLVFRDPDGAEVSLAARLGALLRPARAASGLAGGFADGRLGMRAATLTS